MEPATRDDVEAVLASIGDALDELTRSLKRKMLAMLTVQTIVTVAMIKGFGLA